MAKVRFVGGFDAVFVNWQYQHYTFPYGEAVEVPDLLAEKLLEQDTYEAADDKTRPAAKASRSSAALLGKAVADAHKKPCCDETTDEPCEDCQEDVNG